jgi:hypothetical protein
MCSGTPRPVSVTVNTNCTQEANVVEREQNRACIKNTAIVVEHLSIAPTAIGAYHDLVAQLVLLVVNGHAVFLNAQRDGAAR